MNCYGGTGTAFNYSKLFPEHSLENQILNVYLSGLRDGLKLVDKENKK